eukprot:g12206.t1
MADDEVPVVSEEEVDSDKENAVCFVLKRPREMDGGGDPGPMLLEIPFTDKVKPKPKLTSDTRLSKRSVIESRDTDRAPPLGRARELRSALPRRTPPPWRPFGRGVKCAAHAAVVVCLWGLSFCGPEASAANLRGGLALRCGHAGPGDEAGRRLLEWLAEEGAYVSEALDVVTDPVLGRELVVTEAVDEAQELIKDLDEDLRLALGLLEVCESDWWEAYRAVWPTEAVLREILPVHWPPKRFHNYLQRMPRLEAQVSSRQADGQLLLDVHLGAPDLAERLGGVQVEPIPEEIAATLEAFEVPTMNTEEPYGARRHPVELGSTLMKGPSKGPGGKGRGYTKPEETLEILDAFGIARQCLCKSGVYRLLAHGGAGESVAREERRGTYHFDVSTGKLTEADETILGQALGPEQWRKGMGYFSAEHLEIETPLMLERAADAHLPVVSIMSSEVMVEIQKPEHAGAFIVIPSQFNGVEFPSHCSVVESVEEYKYDHTGGPCAQLAVHPGIAQFLLDNAATDRRFGGLDATRELVSYPARSGSTERGGHAL